MPLLTSPIDGSPMQQIKRFGIELDVCPTSGGVWLDKGELEKLMAFIKQAAEEEAQELAQMSAPRQAAPQQPHYPQQQYQQPRAPRYDYDDDDDYRHKGYKKKSGLSKIADIFDF